MVRNNVADQQAGGIQNKRRSLHHGRAELSTLLAQQIYCQIMPDLQNTKAGAALPLRPASP